MRDLGRLAVAMAALLLVAPSPPAWAEGQAGAHIDGDRITAEVGYQASGASTAASGGQRARGSAGTPRRASFEIGSARVDAVSTGGGCARLTSPAAPGVYARVCGQAFEGATQARIPFSAAGRVFYRVVPVATRQPAARTPRVDVDALALAARESLRLPAPRIATNPRAEWELVVNLPTWLWVEGVWAQHTASATAGPVAAVVTARPQAVVWDLGNGERVTCHGPGTPYDPARPADAQHTDCSYTYARGSAGQPGDVFTVSATVVWSASWTATGAPGGGDLPALTTTSSVPVRVAEVQALNT